MNATTQNVSIPGVAGDAVRVAGIGFAAGFIAFFIAHQPLLAALVKIGFVKATPFATTPAFVAGVPQVLATAFVAGLWGIVLALVLARLSRHVVFWAAALLLGALLPSLVAWFIVAPIQGQPLAAGGDVHKLVTDLATNGAWGLATGALYAVARKIA